MGVSLMRTGKLGFLRMADEMVRHRTEVDQGWSDSDAALPEYRGFQRSGGGYPHFHCQRLTRNQPGVESTWLAGVVLHYMLTGDPKARECIERGSAALEHAWTELVKSRDWYVRRQFGDTQACARSIFSACAVYDLTGEEKWLKLAAGIFEKQVVGRWKWAGPHLHEREQIRSQDYTKDDIKYCYSIQALCLLHQRTGHPWLFELLRVGAERDFPPNFFDAPLFLADLHAYVGLCTGREDRFDAAAEHWIQASPEGDCPPVYLPDNTTWSTRSAMHLRAGHTLQYCFWKRGKLAPSVKVERPKPPPAAQFPEGAGPLVLELEDFVLERAWVKELEGAGGGKAVLFDYLDGRAVRDVKLPAGTYELASYMYAPDGDCDAFYMKLGGVQKRIVAEERKKLSVADKMVVPIGEAGVYQLRVEPADIDFKLDRVEIRRVK
jgi:hypothetical protein